MTVSLRYAARSDVGLVRSNNQDSAYAGPHLLVVADGMGGHAGGDVASALAVTALRPLDSPDHTQDGAAQDLERSVDRARQDLVDASEADPDLTGMGTTVTALLRTGSTLVMAHLGDSRAYLLRGGELTQVTVDHTFVQHLVDTGRITPEEAEHHPQRNVVMRVLGDFDVDLTPDVSVREARPGDRWLLCSDGLSGFVSLAEMAAVLLGTPDVARAAEKLLSLALRSGSTDNVTVLVADVVEDGDDGPAAGVGLTVPQVVGAAALLELPVDDGETTSEGDGTDPDGGPAAAAGGTAATQPLPVEGDDDGPAGGSGAAGPGEGTTDEPDDADARPGRRRRPWLTLLGVVLVLGGLAAVGWAGYRWTQQQFYVGVEDGQVAVFRGIPASAGPVTLSTAVELTGTRVTELPGYVADRLERTIRADSLQDARDRADRLVADALAEEARDATEQPTPAPSTQAPADGTDGTDGTTTDPGTTTDGAGGTTTDGTAAP